MSIYAQSRYRYCVATRNADDVPELDEREPVRFRNEADNRLHQVADGDTWWGIAHQYFGGFSRACGLWWVLCEFQPTPVVDPTLRLAAGAVVVVPSERFLREVVFSAEQRRHH